MDSWRPRVQQNSPAEKGKPVERRGRKATGLRFSTYDSWADTGKRQGLQGSLTHPSLATRAPLPNRRFDESPVSWPAETPTRHNASASEVDQNARDRPDAVQNVPPCGTDHSFSRLRWWRGWEWL